MNPKPNPNPTPAATLYPLAGSVAGVLGDVVGAQKVAGSAVVRGGESSSPAGLLVPAVPPSIGHALTVSSPSIAQVVAGHDLRGALGGKLDNHGLLGLQNQGGMFSDRGGGDVAAAVAPSVLRLEQGDGPLSVMNAGISDVAEAVLENGVGGALEGRIVHSQSLVSAGSDSVVEKIDVGNRSLDCCGENKQNGGCDGERGQGTETIAGRRISGAGVETIFEGAGHIGAIAMAVGELKIQNVENQEGKTKVGNDGVADSRGSKLGRSFADVIWGQSSERKLKKVEVQFDSEGRVVMPKRLIEKGIQIWKNTLVGFVLGRRISMAVIDSNVHRMWKVWGVLEVVSVGAGIVFVRFSDDKHFEQILQKSDWNIAGCPFMVRRWVPGMTYESLEAVQTSFVDKAEECSI